MNVIKDILPDYCYSQRNITNEGAVIHYFSAINVDPDNAFDVDACRHLILDLNRTPVAREWYKMRDLKDRIYASYHYIISRDGEVINLVPPHQRAWHAGKSTMMGRDDCNSWTLGISMLASHTSGFTEEQYNAAAELCFKHNLKSNNTWGHEDVAPKRKKDPGPKWKWMKFNELLDSKY